MACIWAECTHALSVWFLGRCVLKVLYSFVWPRSILCVIVGCNLYHAIVACIRVLLLWNQWKYMRFSDSFTDYIIFSSSLFISSSYLLIGYDCFALTIYFIILCFHWLSTCRNSSLFTFLCCNCILKCKPFFTLCGREMYKALLGCLIGNKYNYSVCLL